MASGRWPSASRPAPERSKSAERKRTAAGGRSRHRDTYDPRLGRHRADHPLLLLDAATRAAATLGTDLSGIIRRKGDSRVSLISNARAGTAGFGTEPPIALIALSGSFLQLKRLARSVALSGTGCCHTRAGPDGHRPW